MRENEAAAHELVRALDAVGVGARVSGGGVHWQVNVAALASRTLIVHCFWYEPATSGLTLVLGMNPSNARSRLGPAFPRGEGVEYLVTLLDVRVRVADGRTSIASDVVTCVRAWLTGCPLEALHAVAPFVDRLRLAMRAIAGRLDPRLRWDIQGDPSYELWVYGDNRSCKVMEVGGRVDCALFVGQAQVAYVAPIEDVPAVAAAWLVQGIPVQQLRAHVPNLELEDHAEVLETDPARWHWLHVRDCLNNPRDVLAPLRGLIEALAGRPVATRFFSYSSLNRFCFSASSHFPWVDDGLPVVSPDAAGSYRVGHVPCDLARAIEVIEATLAAYPVRPFFGSARHHELPFLGESLARQGSSLRPALRQRGGWYRLVVERGPRDCEVDDRTVVFQEGTRSRRISYPSLDGAARAIRSYLEEASPLGELTADAETRSR